MNEPNYLISQKVVNYFWRDELRFPKIVLEQYPNIFWDIDMDSQHLFIEAKLVHPRRLILTGDPEKTLYSYDHKKSGVQGFIPKEIVCDDVIRYKAIVRCMVDNSTGILELVCKDISIQFENRIKDLANQSTIT